ncbi:uncharacterized protein [Watersipora subatra]|uniref:uncharacterized protein isoform X2 n=1 Tax=Watersipora subatra TaxID=2589382 RepID=UPI00355C7862
MRSEKRDHNTLVHLRLPRQVDPTCTQKIYDNCFSVCPPQIPDPPPPPAALKDYKRKWCTGHYDPWSCMDTNSGPSINGSNPRLDPVIETTEPNNLSTVITLSVLIPIVLIVLVLAAVLWYVKKKKMADKKNAANTYNLSYLSKPQVPTWTDNDDTEGAVEDGSEIFYKVDRNAALSATIAGVGNSRSVPDVVHNGTLRRSSSATSQAPLLSSPEIASHNRHRNLANATIQDTGDSDLGSPPYTRFGAGVTNNKRTRNPSQEGITRGTSRTALVAPGMSSGTKSHPNLHNGERSDGTGTIIKTPKVVRQRSTSGDTSKSRPLRRPSGASAVQRSDSMTLNRVPGRENYRNNWENFDEVTATMRKNKGGPSHRELVLGTDSFIDSFTNPEPEEATSIDQLGLPNRNPFLQGYYEFDEEPAEPTNQEKSSFDPNPDDSVFNSDIAVPEGFDGPPCYDDIIPARRTSSLSLSQMPTLDLRVRRDRISEYDSEGSIEV